MLAEERQKRIEEYLLKTEFASLDELSEQLDVSVSTVRRDLAALEIRGILRRTHGGARLTQPKSDEFAFNVRDSHEFEEKEAIAKACAELVLPNQTVIMDAGTTVFHVARYLESKSLQVFTNSLPIANLLSATNRVETVVSGGVIYPRLGVLVGPLAVAAFSKIRSDLAIMGAGGLSMEGISNSHGLLIEIQRAMLGAARKVILCLDHTKFGRPSLSPLCDLDAIHVIVTDDQAPGDMVEALRGRGIEVILAGRS
ncbi:MAG: DeoR/GlpR family DNA-binding transcription regulator [Verrucomicrobia bacterium]|jgi:DeoR/GlpR family transcriptional regulator of sugar metabolism|nr:DeoR/GlpR family DNA-binding transcription regulator [Verrucomicrobiota bacterium]